ncbi:hypothetical protein BSY18_4146 (plasmid) [Blastomonas sp. RAC04]|nr:hypothetical protein BSY18_4146 [Blastomonas sp. RAC04]
MLFKQDHLNKELSPVDSRCSGHTRTENTTLPEHLTACSPILACLKGRQFPGRENWDSNDRYEGG